MKNSLIALGLGTLATVVIGGIVVAVSLLDHKTVKKEASSMPEPENNQPVVTEHVQYDGWSELSEEEFKEQAEAEENIYEPCYASVYSNGYLALDYPERNDGMCTIIIEPHKLTSQKYIPYDYLKSDGYFLNHQTKEAWSVMHLSYRFGDGWVDSSYYTSTAENLKDDLHTDMDPLPGESWEQYVQRIHPGSSLEEVYNADST